MNRFKFWRKRKGGIWVRSLYGLTGWFQTTERVYRTHYKFCIGDSWEVELHDKAEETV